MSAPALRYCVNLSILYPDLPLLERPAAAAAAGFDAVELWWPFPEPAPPDKELDRLRTALADAGTRLVALHFDAGDMAAGDRGLLSRRSGSARFQENIEVAVGFAESTGCTVLNALYGNREPEVNSDARHYLATENLVRAARSAQRIGATVVIEPLNTIENARYPISSSGQALELINTLRTVHLADNVALLADFYQLARMGESLLSLIREHSASFGHVQIADVPGRGQPGTGWLGLHSMLDELAKAGYLGHVGLEYKPIGDTARSFDWLPRELRATRVRGGQAGSPRCGPG